MNYSILLSSFFAILLVTSCSQESEIDLANEPVVNSESVAAVAAVSAPLPQMINIGADSCIPCKQMIPVRNAIANDYAGQIEVSFIDIRNDRSAGSQYGIRVIPTQIIFDAEGNERFRHEGYWPKEEVVKTLEQLELFATETSPNQQG